MAVLVRAHWFGTPPKKSARLRIEMTCHRPQCSKGYAGPSDGATTSIKNAYLLMMSERRRRGCCTLTAGKAKHRKLNLNSVASSLTAKNHDAHA
jgi:hypothetical protein